MEEIKAYLQRQMLLVEKQAQAEFNGQSPTSLQPCRLYQQLEKYLRDFSLNQHQSMHWIIIPGLRGVGKTTIMHQLLSNHRSWLAQKGLGAQLLFISLDEVVY